MHGVFGCWIIKVFIKIQMGINWKGIIFLSMREFYKYVTLLQNVPQNLLERLQTTNTAEEQRTLGIVPFELPQLRCTLFQEYDCIWWFHEATWGIIHLTKSLGLHYSIKYSYSFIHVEYSYMFIYATRVILYYDIR